MVHSAEGGSIPVDGASIVRDYWSAICDCDWHQVPEDVRDTYEDAIISQGLAVWDAVDDDDLDNPFAEEIGIVPGGSVLRLTPAGRAAFLSPIQHGHEGAESGEVSPNLKAKAQGEGG
jgi:hypothetical protein